MRICIMTEECKKDENTGAVFHLHTYFLEAIAKNTSEKVAVCGSLYLNCDPRQLLILQLAHTSECKPKNVSCVDCASRSPFICTTQTT